MPKELGHFGEWATRSTSKNAKDKNNSATLRASQAGYHREQSGMADRRNRMLCCHSDKGSEKDSGYSEAGSDSFQTDVDDQRSSVSEPHTESRKSSNNSSVNVAGDNLLSYEELTPIYIIENLVVKPSRPEQPLLGPVTWGGGWHGLTSAKAPTQLLLIQQSSLPDPSTSVLTPSSLAGPHGQVKEGGSHSNQNHNSNTSYLPILNSYPRIAPHPRKESHESKVTTNVEELKYSGSEGQSQSKRVCIEKGKKEAFSTTSHPLKPQLQKESRVHSYSQYKGREGRSSLPNSQHKSHHYQQVLISDSVSSPSISSSQTPSHSFSSVSPSSSSPPSSSPTSSMAHSPNSLGLDNSTRQRRFLNTAEILKQSGLLAITLRTKELLKLNATTDKEIAQLHQHTHLLCKLAQASQNGCNKSPDSLSKLLQAMTESGSYPNLDLNHLKALSSNYQKSKSRSGEQKEAENNIRTAMTQSNLLQVLPLCNVDDGTSPPSPLFALLPDTEENRAC